jgi:4-oxalocrotonate tautomerase family enzyme
MPVAKIYVPEGALTSDQRREIIKGIHDAINRVEKRPPNGLTYVVVTEIAASNWGVAGTVYRPG